MIILGIVLLIIGFLAHISVIWTIGIILIVVGAILALLGTTGWPSAAGDTGTDPCPGRCAGRMPKGGKETKAARIGVELFGVPGSRGRLLAVK